MFLVKSRYLLHARFLAKCAPVLDDYLWKLCLCTRMSKVRVFFSGNLNVCMLSLCDCIHRKGQHQLGQGERSSKKSYFPNRTSKPGPRHTIGCHAADFALGNTTSGLHCFTNLQSKVAIGLNYRARYYPPFVQLCC